MNRRTLLKSTGALASTALAGFHLPIAHAASARRRLCVFVQADGGWDPTSFCDPKTNTPGEPVINHWAESNETQKAGRIPYAPFADNRRLFEKHHRNMLVVNGVDAQTNSHTVGIVHNWSGRNSEGYPATTAMLAAHSAPELPVSYVNFGGYSETGGLTRYTRLDNPDLLRSIAYPRGEGDSDDPEDSRPSRRWAGLRWRPPSGHHATPRPSARPAPERVHAPANQRFGFALPDTQTFRPTGRRADVSHSMQPGAGLCPSRHTNISSHRPAGRCLTLDAARCKPLEPARWRGMRNVALVCEKIRSIPPHTFFRPTPRRTSPTLSSPPRGPLDRSRSVPPRAFPSATGFAFALIDDARRDGDDSRRKEPDPAMVAKEIDAPLTCMGPKRGLAIGRAAGRPENVGDVLRGVGRKSVWRESPVNRSIGSVGHRCHGHGQSPGGWVSSSRSTSASFRTAHRLFA